MTATAFDTLKFARRLKDSGVGDSQAEAKATAIQEAFTEALETQLATKQLATKDDIQAIMVAINKIEVGTQASISELKATTESSISELKATTQASISEVKTKLEAKITLIQWMPGIVIATQVLPLLRSVGVL